MEEHKLDSTHPARIGTLSNEEVLRELISDGTSLLKRQLELARTEATENLRAALVTTKAMGFAIGLANAGLVLILVAGSLAIGASLSLVWAGPLIVAAVILVVAGLVGAIAWRRRLRGPLSHTRRGFDKELNWAKNQVNT